MIILRKGQQQSVFFNITTGYTEDTFKFIITSTSTLDTHVITLTKLESTIRYDKYVIDDTTLNLPISNYDYVLVKDVFAGNYDTVMDILLEYPNAVIQTGKFRVMSNTETPIVEYITDKPEINDYEPENI